ncbi:autoinducer binding domain-containing protein [Pararhizobium sp.]|uniref:autoinducer binding domain-containing protein n=1 Tax=Pararhizobium sp. TaxID=1977563 RepID=UPI003D100015
MSYAGDLSKETRQFYSEAREFGIRSGVSIPVLSGLGNVAMLTLAQQARALFGGRLRPCHRCRLRCQGPREI